MTARRLYIGGLALVLPAVLVAQNQTRFRVEANYVEVDAVVTDKTGNFVTGLTAADFEVRELRQPQQISTFTYVDLPTSPGSTSASPSPVRIRPDLPQSERVNADRIYLIYLNSRSIAT